MVYGVENGGYGYCEDCEIMITAEDAAPEGLCYECYADRVADSVEDSLVRGYLLRNRYDFIGYLRENT